MIKKFCHVTPFARSLSWSVLVTTEQKRYKKLKSKRGIKIITGAEKKLLLQHIHTHTHRYSGTLSKPPRTKLRWILYITVQKENLLGLLLWIRIHCQFDSIVVSPKMFLLFFNGYNVSVSPNWRNSRGDYYCFLFPFFFSDNEQKMQMKLFWEVIVPRKGLSLEKLSRRVSMRHVFDSPPFFSLFNWWYFSTFLVVLSNNQPKLMQLLVQFLISIQHTHTRKGDNLTRMSYSTLTYEKSAKIND